uniref:Zinc finger protein OZF-like n=2 Tax=Cynoglossus semilaevis TaxID=244447 RepID=A0A3P8UZK8_CYNSE
MLTLKCPRSLRESDLLDLIRSSVPQLAGQNQPFDILTSDKGRSLQCLDPKTWTLEEFFENIHSAEGQTSTIFIRPKIQKETEKMEEGSNLETKASTSAAPMWPCEDISPQTSSYLCDEKVEEEEEEEEEAKEEGRSINILFTSSTSQEESNMLTEEANDENLRMLPVLDTVFCPTAQSEHEVKVGKDLRPDEREEKNQNMKMNKQENGDNIPVCKVCGAFNGSDEAFVQHVWSHTDDAGSVCGICGERLETTEFLKDHLQQCHESHSIDEHMTTQSDRTLQKCNLCEAAFVSKMSLENHQKIHEGLKPQEELKKKKMHMCGVCGKSLSDYRSLSRHKMIHSGERPHRCEVCGRSFKLAGTLRQHEKIHMDRERSYLCDVCCKMFLTSKQLQIHMRTHTDEKPYSCNQCGRGFNTKGTLTIHMRIHTGETPYRCPDCGWAFKRKSNLDNHVTTHSGVKAFICGVCGKACARKTHLNVHMRTHNGERPYKCTLCDKAFTQSHCLKTHMKSHRTAEAVT